ncbi:MAG: ATP-binding protein, partial [Acidobacteriota bacterium]
GSVGEKGQRMLEMAVTNTDRLVRLINDILDLERIESGKVKLARGPVDANAIMLQTVGGLRAIADEAGVAVVIVPATAFVWGDSDRIIQTLTNLVGNSIKFSPAGTTVIVSGSRVEGDFAFCVSDQGRGVPEEKRKTIFERFNQVDASDSRDKGGSGLGLAICQSIVDAHGGEIWVEPNQPAGSRFCFTIPLATPLQLGASEAESVASTPPESVEVARAPLVDRVFDEGHPTAAEAGNTSVRHVLVIDDERDIRDVISASLQLSEGWTVVTANGGTAGAALAQTSAPDAILLDIMMPELDGPSTLRALRAQVANRSTPVIFLTAKVQVAERQKFMQLGVRGIISKPFDPLTLGQQIKDLLWWT